MEFRILGPLEVDGDPGAVVLGGIKPRVILAMLLLHANEPVSAERLALALWGDEAPARRGQDACRCTSRGCARRSATPDIVTHDAGGLPPARRPGRARRRAFRRACVEDGRRALADGQPERAAAFAARGAERCGAARPSRTWRSSRSRRPRSRGSRSSGWPRSRRASRPTSRRPARRLVGELQQLVADASDARAARRAADARALPLRPAGRGARGLPRRAARAGRRSSASSPARSCGACTTRSCATTPSLELTAAGAELPRELEVVTEQALVGRDAELGWLREHWERARSGAGALVTLDRARAASARPGWSRSSPARRIAARLRHALCRPARARRRGGARRAGSRS